MTEAEMFPLGPAPPKDLTVAEIRRRYLAHAAQYYRRPDGTSTGEADNASRALAALDPLAELPASDFGPRALKAVRQTMIEHGLARSTINARVNVIRRAWKWAVSEELLPETAYAGLAAVAGLRAGRSAARETPPVGPVDEAWVDATLPFLPPTVQAMIRLQLFTAMRPGEICALRPCDLDARGSVWFYSPLLHKTAHRGRTRVIPIGPRAQQLLKPFLKGGLEVPCFSPQQAQKERRTRRRRLARRPRPRRDLVGRPWRTPPPRPVGDRYTSAAYYHAVQYAVARANRARRQIGKDPIPAWSPNQLRHTAATRVRRELGLEAARALLGHTDVTTTEAYAELDRALAVKAVRQLG